MQVCLLAFTPQGCLAPFSKEPLQVFPLCAYHIFLFFLIQSISKTIISMSVYLYSSCTLFRCLVTLSYSTSTVPVSRPVRASSPTCIFLLPASLSAIFVGPKLLVIHWNLASSNSDLLALSDSLSLF